MFFDLLHRQGFVESQSLCTIPDQYEYLVSKVSNDGPGELKMCIPCMGSNTTSSEKYVSTQEA